MPLIPQTKLPSGENISRLGQGTWRMGENPAWFEDEVRALRIGLDLGLTLIDTAEMYGEGGAEEVVAQAIQNRRDEVFIVSKVYPHNAGGEDLTQACERSLKRLKTDRIDLYLLHWRGGIPLSETVEGFESLKRHGKIRHWGVSNFDTPDMEELFGFPQGGRAQTNQVLYNLRQREMEWSLQPWCHQRGIPLMAYCPLGQGELSSDRTLKTLAERHQATPAQIALAWLLMREDVIAIPKAVQASHIRENVQALELRLTSDDLAELDRAFPPPRTATSLETV